MKRIGSVLRRVLRRQARGDASQETHRQGPYRMEAGEQSARAEPARIVFAPTNDAVFWAGEDEEGFSSPERRAYRGCVPANPRNS